jgi:beta-phosphoglucomutase
MPEIKACLFDLDGVIVDTAKYHFLAWRRLANTMGIDFNEEENEQLKGVSRMQSLEFILNLGQVHKSDAEKEELAHQKNEWYKAYIHKMQPEEILPGALQFLKSCKAQGIAIGLGSASKNAPTILEQIGITDLFDVVIDGNVVSKSKPHPEVFLKGAEALHIAPENTVVFEDAPKGIDAALAGGMWAVGVGSPEVLGHAHWVIPGFEGVDIQLFDKLS